MARKKIYGKGRSKFGVSPKKERTIDGIVFHSKGEANRFKELKFLLANGVIVDLELQPSFSFDYNGQHICKYKADFRYTVAKSGEDVIEDVKGNQDAVFKLKKKMFEAWYPELELVLVKPKWEKKK